MRSTRTRKRPRTTSTSCSPTRPTARWPSPSSEAFAHAATFALGIAACATAPSEMTAALILAAGRGERLGGPGPKALVELAGRPLLQWSIDALRAVKGIETIV